MYFGIDTGISVIQNQDGTFYQTTYPSTDEYNAAKNVYLGGYDYYLSDAQYADLVAAGYLPYIVSDGDPAGFGQGPYGSGSYGT